MISHFTLMNGQDMVYKRERKTDKDRHGEGGGVVRFYTGRVNVAKGDTFASLRERVKARRYDPPLLQLPSLPSLSHFVLLSAYPTWRKEERKIKAGGGTGERREGGAITAR